MKIEVCLSIGGILSKPLLECEVEAKYIGFNIFDLTTKKLFTLYNVKILSDDIDLYKRFQDKFKARDVHSEIKVLVKHSEGVYLELGYGTYVKEYNLEVKHSGLYELSFELRT